MRYYLTETLFKIVDMENLKIKPENPYCYVDPIDRNELCGEKIDELLTRVERIESTLLEVNNRLSHPVLPPKPAVPSQKPSKPSGREYIKNNFKK